MTDELKIPGRNVLKKRIFEDSGIVCFYILCALFIFLPKILQGFVLAPEDDFVQNYPAFASSIGLWTPLLLGGFPILADPQIQFFYPLAWLAKHLSADQPTNFSIYIMSAYVLAASFTALLCRRLTGSRYGAILAGLTYGFSGYLISELKHVQVLHTAVWLPLLFYLVEAARPDNLARSATYKPFVYPAISLAVAILIFAGHPQTAFYILASTLIYAVVIYSRRDKTSITPLLLTLLSILAGVALAAVQLLPSLELSAFSGREQFTFKDMIVGQVEPLQVVGFLLPYIMGGSYGTIGNLPFAEQGAPPGLLFLGFAPLFLAGLAISKKKQERRVIFLVALLAFVLLLSLGANTPLASFVYYIPVMGKFRGLYRILLLAGFAVAVLSAYGLAYIEEHCAEPSIDPARLGPLKHVYLLIYIVLSAFSYVFFLGSMPLALFLLKNKRLQSYLSLAKMARQKILVGCAFIAIATYGLNAEWVKNAPKRGDFEAPVLARTYKDKTAAEHCRIFSIAGIDAPGEALPPNLSRLWQVSSAAGYEPLISSRYGRLLGIAEAGFMRPPWHIAATNRAFDLVGIKYLLAPAGENFAHHAFDEQAKQNWQAIDGAKKCAVYKNARSLPRFYFVSEGVDLDAEAIFKTITTGKFADGKIYEPSTTVLLENSSDFKRAAIAGADLQKTKNDLALINKAQIEDEKLSFDLQVEKAAYFVLADSCYPGWQARLDGQAVPILAANYVQRAVLIGPGRHQLVMTYEPQSLERGLQISGAIIMLWILILLVWFAGIKFGGRERRTQRQ